MAVNVIQPKTGLKPNDERIFEHSSILEILYQRRRKWRKKRKRGKRYFLQGIQVFAAIEDFHLRELL